MRYQSGEYVRSFVAPLIAPSRAGDAAFVQRLTDHHLRACTREDAIALSDHIEYQPHKADMVKNHNRSYAIAREAGEDLSLIVVKANG